MAKTKQVIKEQVGTWRTYAIFAMLFVVFFPAWETRVFPVTTGTEILDISSAYEGDNFRTTIALTALKVRDCPFSHVEIFLGDRADLRVQREFAEFLDKPQIRSPGVLEWDKFTTNLDEHQFLNDSYADVYHSCYWVPVLRNFWPEWAPVYLTKSHFWN